MVLVADELKRKQAEIRLRIEELRLELAALEQQQAAFVVVIRTYEPEYDPGTEPRVFRRRSKRDGSNTDGVSDLFRDFDRRGFALRTLREAGRPITTVECATAFARETGLGDNDAGPGKIGNALSQVLDQLASVLPERRVTVHTGDMGYTFGLCEESEGALAGV
ncbi:hypothetical protein N2600_16355 [Rhizobium sp. WSM1274]|uniref:hypothetical protein n=1 Tax=unclassified Rhizobium TaxID=2613769 RepID=UPI0021A53EBF|nr:hypothetical protein [Rhizobium leguminosarum]UWM80195.1 hypothetical protein N2A41_15905 [Rhizobium leguminosarum bv. viciae]UWU26959.1 hypothetical protein N2600_16355 [Rhizobium leguminosarum bv. viciae]